MKLLHAHYPWQDSLQRELLQADLNPPRLIAGVSGLAKAELAAALARRHLCGEGEDISCRCHSCRLWAQHNHPDLLYIAPAKDSSTIGIAQVRQALEFVHLTPSVSQHRILLFNRVDRMTRQASNALLKTLEEPPQGSGILLTATQASGLPPTVRSRLIQHDLQPPSHSEAVAWCRERNDALSESEWAMLLQLAGGGPLAALKFASGSDGGNILQNLLPHVEKLLHGEDVALIAAEQWEKQELYELALLLLRHLAVSAAMHQVASPAEEAGADEAWQRCLKQASRIPLRLLCDLEYSGRQALSRLNSGGLSKKWLVASLLTEWQRQAVV